MAFENEMPTVQKVERFGLQTGARFLQPEWHRILTVDHERNFHLWGGLTGNPRHCEKVQGDFDFYLNGDEFRVLLSMARSTRSVTDLSYLVRWDAVETIWTVHAGQHCALPESAWDAPHVGHALLRGRSPDQFLTLLKEALRVHGAGDSNQLIKGPIVVVFNF